MNTTTKETVTEDMSFLEDFAGAGLETITADAQAVSYLGMVQPGSSVVDDDNAPGTWRNSATNRNYGNTIRVIPVAFKTIWNERASEPPFNTVGRYEPNSFKPQIQQPKPGSKGYPKMINPDTGNEVQELYVYAVILPDYPEDGVLYFNPTVGSMKACKSWNTQLKGQILPNGAQAPIFGYTWYLSLDLVPNPKKPTEQIAKFVKTQKDAVVSKEIFTQYVRPQLEAVSKAVLSITDNSEYEDEE